jgi:hypothetical protein
MVTPEFTLKSGRAVSFDLSKMTVLQWRAMHNPAFSDEVDDELLAAVSGLTVAELQALPMDEYNRLFYAVVKKVKAPLADPN